MARNNAGIILATGKDLIPQIRKPVANMIRPPTAEKSAIISGVVNGKIMPAPMARANFPVPVMAPLAGVEVWPQDTFSRLTPSRMRP